MEAWEAWVRRAVGEETWRCEAPQVAWDEVRAACASMAGDADLLRLMEDQMRQQHVLDDLLPPPAIYPAGEELGEQEEQEEQEEEEGSGAGLCLEQLPGEVLALVLAFVGVGQLLACRLVCRRMRDVADDPMQAAALRGAWQRGSLAAGTSLGVGQAGGWRWGRGRRQEGRRTLAAVAACTAPSSALGVARCYDGLARCRPAALLRLAGGMGCGGGHDGHGGHDGGHDGSHGGGHDGGGRATALYACGRLLRRLAPASGELLLRAGCALGSRSACNALGRQRQAQAEPRAGQERQAGYARAACLYAHAASRRHAAACFHLAWLLEAGLGLRQDLHAAARLYAMAARLACHLAQNNLAWCYQYGRGVARNERLAREWYGRAAAQGNGSARTNLAHLLLEGLGGPRDEAQARSLLQAAAAQGNGPAMLHLGRLCQAADDHHRAVAWFTQAATLACPPALYQLGRCYQRGLGLEQDLRQARRLYKAAAKLGDRDGQFHLGLMYEKGCDKAPKPAKGHATALNNLGWCLQYGVGVQADVRAAFRCYQQSAQLACPEGENNLAWMYQRGVGTEVDLQEAFRWYRRSAGQDNGQAITNLAHFYEHGLVGPVDLAKALKYYRRAAERGNTQAIVNLARFYEEGVGVEADVARAAAYYRAGAVRDSPHACFMLARLLHGGRVEGRVEAVAAGQLYERAARLGHAEAAAALARMAQAGDGVPRDEARALQLYAQAAAGGCVPAMLALAQLHARGRRTPHGRTPDPQAARTYLEMAARHGHQPSVRKVAQLRDKEERTDKARDKGDKARDKGDKARDKEEKARDKEEKAREKEEKARDKEEKARDREEMLAWGVRARGSTEAAVPASARVSRSRSTTSSRKAKRARRTPSVDGRLHEEADVEADRDSSPTSSSARRPVQVVRDNILRLALGRRKKR